MSEKLCELRKKGGGSGKYTETSLWTNQSPSSAFAAQTVSLSDNLSKYKYVKVKFKFETSSTSDNAMGSFIVSVDEFKKATYNSYNNIPTYMVGTANTSYHFSRYFEYVNDTSIYFSPAYTVNNANSNNSRSIPLEILGLNELDHGEVLSVSNPMICTPFRNTTPSGSTLTFTEAGTYLLVYFNQTTTTTETPTVVSGSMTIKQTLSAVTSANAYSSISGNMRAVTFEIEVTANTEIRGSVSSSNTMAYAIKLN